MIYKNNINVFREKRVPLPDGESFPVLCLRDWEKLKGVRNCFTTRAGGVSEGWLASLNFRRGLYDPEENILENFTRIARYFDVGPERIVHVQQTHTANVRIITEEDAGKGVIGTGELTDSDGMITNVPGLVLYISVADCVPLYFYDPVKRVIALSHSGWKGTVNRIGEVTIRKMRERYGCNPSDIYTAIGPSICSDCYEISEDVAEEFCRCFSVDLNEMTAPAPHGSEPVHDSEKSLPEKEEAEKIHIPGRAQHAGGYREIIPGRAQHAGESREIIPGILRTGKRAGHYQLDLWQANVRIFIEAGISPEHITVTNLCTCENPAELFSHRATAGKRGNQGAFLMLEQPASS